ncbi:MAG TPA: hypothetical protein VL326_35010 [Kofleriaceae bacterium]|jgi:hypothetical protein|nr:hypothetical protein [Kofleriaceae bacterium]
MKIVAIIFAVLTLLATSFVALAAANKAHKLAGDVAQVEKMTKGMSAQERASFDKEVGGIPSSGRLNGGAVVGGLGGLAAFVLLIAMFAKKDWAKGLAGATFGAALLSALVYPHVQTGPMDGAAPRSLAIACIVMGAIGAACATFAARKTS